MLLGLATFLPSKQSVDGLNPSGGVEIKPVRHWVLGIPQGQRLVADGFGSADPQYAAWLVDLWKQK